MDLFSHALVSFTLARARPAALPRRGAAMLVLSGVAADLDYASYAGGPGAFLHLHRALFHSVPAAALLACSVAAVFCLIDRKSVGTFNAGEARNGQSFARAFVPALAVCAAGVASHIFLDLASGEGVQLLWPFRVHWTAWSLASNFDPWVLALLSSGLLIPLLFGLVGEEVGARKKSSSGVRAAIFILLLLAAYLGARAGLHSRAIDLLLSTEYHGREPLAAGAFPSSPNPMNWRGVVSTADTIEEIDVHLSQQAAFNPDASLTHYKPQGSPALEAAERTSASRTFLKYAEFPLAGVNKREDGYRIDVHDVRFPEGDENPANIAVRIDLDSALHVAHEEFRYSSSSNP